ncbi:1-aminocyclopropane-1-carboxylate deaminase/D-cysteine desulfhydrase [Spirillospora sp. CA-294931]|uniref:1-aminocyclopropane-1-carboxylate deaminase/D-cysteine desulfhydrase n=1 Tax=Spirillospora sp. CA-294931 TaxID=3240042 RepID=UPI003D8D8060
MPLPSPLTELHDDHLTRHGPRLFLKRDDLIDPDIPGNKWRKLKHNLTAARDQGHTTLLTFGGAYSNHIRATAAAGRRFGFATLGVIRGEEHDPLNPSLARARADGMRLTYLDRATYRRKTDPDVIAALHRRFGDFYLLPEGGSNALAVLGCAELPTELDTPYDLICCPCGTGATLAGLASAAPARALGFSVLKGGPFLDREVTRLQREAGTESSNWALNYDYHFGGFARRPQTLEAFATGFHRRNGIALDLVYVAKMMYGIYDLAARGTFPAGTRIVAVITG